MKAFLLSCIVALVAGPVVMVYADDEGIATSSKISGAALNLINYSGALSHQEIRALYLQPWR